MRTGVALLFVVTFAIGVVLAGIVALVLFHYTDLSPLWALPLIILPLAIAAGPNIDETPIDRDV